MEENKENETTQEDFVLSNKSYQDRYDELKKDKSKFTTALQIDTGSGFLECVISLDFMRFAQCQKLIMGMAMEASQNKETSMKMDIDPLQAGDHALVFGWQDMFGDTEIQDNISYRIEANNVLGNWILELINQTKGTKIKQKKN